jgi:hypothetical protein
VRVTINIFTKIFLSLLVLIGTAFFVVPATEVEAQSQIQKPVCLNTSTGDLYTTGCPTASPWVTSNMILKKDGFCKKALGANSYTIDQVDSRKTTSGDTEYKLNRTGDRCIDIYTSEITEKTPGVPVGIFIKYSTLSTYGTTTPPIIPPTTTGGTKPQTPKPTGGTTTTTTPSDTCDGNFKKVGPLCVPKSNFGADTIAGETDAPGLAARIIRILLYFAGIVAVIMIIYGGYLVMTAAGNETQAATGRKTLTNAIIGLVIVVLAYFVIQVVINFVS